MDHRLRPIGEDRRHLLVDEEVHQWEEEEGDRREGIGEGTVAMEVVAMGVGNAIVAAAEEAMTVGVLLRARHGEDGDNGHNAMIS